MSDKISIRMRGVTSTELIFDSFEDFRSKCIVNGSNLDKSKHFEHACKPEVCTNWFSETLNCNQEDCPALNTLGI